MHQIAVVILNWNGAEYLKKFLPTLIQYSNQARIIVADNGSTDQSVSILQAEFPQVRLIILDRNYGFCEGYNRALQQVHAKYYVLLNSDVQVTDGWLQPMYALLESKEAIAACQPKILSYAEPTKFEYAGAAGGFIDYLGTPFCRGRIFQHVESDLGQYNDTTEIFWATGACLMIRAESYNEMHGLDADFFAHMEEIDLCWRLINSGKKIFYCGASTVYHVGGGTLNKSNPHKTYLNFRNNLYMLHKNLPHQLLLKTIFYKLILDGIAAIKMMVESGFAHFVAVLKAHFAYYGQIRNLNKKRKQIHVNPPHKLPNIIYRKSIIFDYFLRGRKVF